MKKDRSHLTRERQFRAWMSANRLTQLLKTTLSHFKRMCMYSCSYVSDRVVVLTIVLSCKWSSCLVNDWFCWFRPDKHLVEPSAKLSGDERSMKLGRAKKEWRAINDAQPSKERMKGDQWCSAKQRKNEGQSMMLSQAKEEWRAINDAQPSKGKMKGDQWCSAKQRKNEGRSMMLSQAKEEWRVIHDA